MIAAKEMDEISPYTDAQLRESMKQRYLEESDKIFALGLTYDERRHRLDHLRDSIWAESMAIRGKRA